MHIFGSQWSFRPLVVLRSCGVSPHFGAINTPNNCSIQPIRDSRTRFKRVEVMSGLMSGSVPSVPACYCLDVTCQNELQCTNKWRDEDCKLISINVNNAGYKTKFVGPQGRTVRFGEQTLNVKMTSVC